MTTLRHLLVASGGAAALIAALLALHDPVSRAPSPRFAEGADDDPAARAEMELLMLRDPASGRIPPGIRRRELALARTLPLRATRGRSEGDRASRAAAITWTERGPRNVGGRTRAFAVDVASPGVLIAGSVAGGLWRSTDDGASWSLRTAPGQLHGITCLAQDRRPGRTHVWYAGTGEIRGSTTNDTRWGSLYRGDGIFKSVDGGLSWSLLPATVSGTPQVSDAFDFVVDLATNPANLAQDEVLAATHTGIRRSLDGGASWTTVLASDSGYTDVAVTPAGVMYAHTRSGGVARIWRSTNGASWTAIQPAGFPTVANRVAIGLAPSNPNLAYVFVQGANNSPHVGGHQVWRYDYLSGDGAGGGGAWVNRAVGLPAGINTQGGYDMLVDVKPDDENLVLIGGTDLYRSSNGFATAAATEVIGGYSHFPGGGHHPDLHVGAFSPLDPRVYYSAHDGGLSRTADLLMPVPMEWTSLNNGYNVTQFYSVSIAPEAGSDLILAGAQDNGTQMGTQPGASDWVMVYGGDGTVVEVAPAPDDRLYTQYQNGNMQRQNRDGSALTDMTPAGSANRLFVNPIALDPANSTILYYGGGISSNTSRVWRNDNAPAATTAVGWSHLAATEVGTGPGYARRISALGVSTANDPHVLYYGTVDGIVRRVANAHTAAPAVTTISPPGLNAGTASGGFVRCIAVDPTDSGRAILAFGNYNFPSLWLTENGGASWTDIEGNLAGPAGPSVRWVQMVQIEGRLEVFLGTSVGVLSTPSLAGAGTMWFQEAATEIGNVIIGYMDYRESDRTLAVGTHGRGVFTARFTPNVAAGEGAAGPRLRLGAATPNPARETATFDLDLPAAAEVSFRLYDVTGRRVATVADGPMEAGRHRLRATTARLAPGTYYAVLRAGATTETRRVAVRR